MISSVITFIEEVLIPFGGMGVFMASVIEEIIAPIPSPLIQMAAGFFLLPEELTISFAGDFFLKVVFPASLGVALGSLVVYYIGYYSGKPALYRWGKFFGLRWNDVNSAYSRFRNTKTDLVVLFFLRATPIIPSVAISAVCGIIRMPVWPYLVYSFFGTMVRASFLGIIGWRVGSLYQEYSDVVERFETSIFTVVLVVLLTYVVYRAIRSKIKV